MWLTGDGGLVLGLHELPRTTLLVDLDLERRQRLVLPDGLLLGQR